MRPEDVDVVVFHSPCQDGDFAAAVAVLFNSSIVCVPLAQPVVEAGVPWEKFDDKNVLWLDIAPHPSWLTRYREEDKVVPKWKSVYVLDHHLSTFGEYYRNPHLLSAFQENSLNEYSREKAREQEFPSDHADCNSLAGIPNKCEGPQWLIDSNKSGCKLAWEFFFGKAEPLPTVLQLVDARDLGWKKCADVESLGKMQSLRDIEAVFPLVQSMEDRIEWIKRKVWSEKEQETMQEKGRLELQRRREEVKEYLAQLRLVQEDIDGRVLHVAYVPFNFKRLFDISAAVREQLANTPLDLIAHWEVREDLRPGQKADARTHVLSSFSSLPSSRFVTSFSLRCGHDDNEDVLKWAIWLCDHGCTVPNAAGGHRAAAGVQRPGRCHRLTQSSE